jgi:hypothetical protein
MHRSKKVYSITSSAMASKVPGTSTRGRTASCSTVAHQRVVDDCIDI